MERALLERLPEAAVGGGRTHDALAGATAAAHGVRLVTADRRALPVYALVGTAGVMLLQEQPLPALAPAASSPGWRG